MSSGIAIEDFYETDRAVAEYLLFHYGHDDMVLPWPTGPRDALHFPERCVSACLLAERLPRKARALDLGCGVGRATFELSRHCHEVVGIDRSTRFIAAARTLQSVGHIDFDARVEGDSAQRVRVTVPEGTNPSRITFESGDALNLRPDLGCFDVILAANLLDRVPLPGALLGILDRLVTPQGHLILTSPYTWIEEFTPRKEWLGADGRGTSAVLGDLLPGFMRARRLDLPFLLREHIRKYQWSVSEASVWVRREEGQTVGLAAD